MIDTHCHIYDAAYDADRSETLQRALQAGVTDILMPCIDRDSFGAMMRVAEQYSQCHSMIGVHPTVINRDCRQDVDFVREKLASAPPHTFVAIGEIGIDAYWSTELLDEQKTAFAEMLCLAREYDLPIVIHSRNAFAETFEALRQYRNSLQGVFHAFSGDTETYRTMKLYGDFKVGIGGMVTFKNAGLSATLKDIPLADIVLETDAPYLAPAPYRGKRNESAYLAYIVQKIADIKQITPEEVIETTTLNAKRLFGL